MKMTIAEEAVQIWRAFSIYHIVLSSWLPSLRLPEGGNMATANITTFTSLFSTGERDEEGQSVAKCLGSKPDSPNKPGLATHPQYTN